MGATYEELIADAVPRIVETEKDYERLHDRMRELLRKGSGRTKAETRLFRLLAMLVEDYDRRRRLPPDDATPAERLRFLVDHSGRSGGPLLEPVFGSRSHVSEALHGKRSISADQARKLGKMFHVSPAYFL